MFPITVNYDELILDIKNKSHAEVASIKDETERYLKEAGTEKTEEINRCLTEANADFVTLCSRFLSTDAVFSANDEMDSVPESITYQFAVTERRLNGKGAGLARLIHSFLVNATLSKFYVAVNAPDFSKWHTELATADAANITKMLYSKRPPLAP